MLSLDAKIINELVDILKYFLEYESQRHNFLTLVFGANHPILQQIDFQGSIINFIPNMVRTLLAYGKSSSGKQALSVLLEYVKQQVGIDEQQRIDRLIANIVLETTLQSSKIVSKPTSQLLNNNDFISQEYLGEAGNIFLRTFIGRKEELEELEQLIINGQNRLITLVGMAGIGKSRLAAQLTQIVKHRFDYVIWKNLRIASSFEEFITSLVDFISVNYDEQPSPSSDRITYIINFLKDNKCLIIFDDLTEILYTSNNNIIYQEKWLKFALFLEKLIIKNHQSFIIITCHQVPQDLEYQKIRKYYTLFDLKGLKLADIQKIFQNLYLYTEEQAEDNWQSLVNYYGGNPTVLEIVSKKITNNYDGNISLFIEEYFRHGNNQVSEEINAFLNKHFNSLSDDEKQVMFLLTIENESMSFQKLRGFIGSNTNSCLNKLEFLSLIKKDQSGYYSQVPMVMDYVNQKLIDSIVTEICNYGQSHQLKFLNEYYLINPQAKDYLKDVQKRRILQPVIRELIIKFGGNLAIQERLKEILYDWQTEQPIYGYIGGNITNLLLELNAKQTS
ncbi:NACHT domain-containing protein [Nostoc sp. CENA67]|uniref:NACHT domain-containing protein n=1 Tax=Amazonocrinis nigriterrae CENA67 TaxID=2794033 RepID=A0A8J7HNX0_9NOST|nr:NB-ARC domain-containing protein [Amazonocrinis nigriterrae]MBH8562927.1 NACHT domain-containing protein [Amazonocrinis nigriterrae CENA67]